MAPRSRIRLLLPVLLLTLVALAAPASALAGPPGFASACGGAGDALTTAVDTTTVSSSWQNADITVNLTGTNVAGWEWMVDCGTVQSGGPGSSVVFNVSGQHVLSHRARDAGGLWTDWADSVVKLDKGVPINTTGVPPTWSTSGITINVTGADTVSSVPLVHWNLDGGGWQSGASGSGVTVNTEGPHSIVTWVEDAAGNQSTPRTDTFGIDSTPPVDQTTPPSGWQYTDTYITVHGLDTGAGVSQVQWKIDGVLGTGANNASVHMPEGSHSFQTQIVDGAGNVSGWSPTSTVMVDTTGPTDTTVVPGTWQRTVPVNVTVQGTDTGGSGIDHVDWVLDGVSGTATGISHVVPVTGDGDHVLQTRVVDAGGNDSGWTTRHVRIDTLVPTDTTTMSAGWQTQPVDVSVTGTDADSGVAHVDWQLDNGGQQTAVGSATVHVSGDGVHTLLTRVVDVAGNVTGWKTTTVRIDASSPHNTTPQVPNTAWRSTPYTVQLTGDDDVSGLLQMHYKIDNGTDTAGPSGVLRATVSGAGTHTLSTWAEDVAGNTSGPRNETINIDNVAPTNLTAGPGVPVQNNYPMAINGSDAHSGVNIVKWKLDNGAVQSGPNGSIVNIAGNGPHTLQTMIVDNAGNDSGWLTTTVTVDTSLVPDTTPPTDTSSASSSSWSPGSVSSLSVSADDGSGSGVAWVQYRIDGVISSQITWHEGDTPVPVSISGDGQHLLETRAADNQGNVSTWRMQTVNIDTRQPVDTSVLPAAGAWTNTRTFTLSGDDPLPGSGVQDIEYRIDGGALSTVASGATVSVPSDGPHTIWHRAVDFAGQASSGVTSSFKVDTVLPLNTSPAAPTTWQTVSGISLALTGTDALSGVARAEWRVSGGAVSPSWTASVLTDGVQLLETRIVDNAGNASAWRQETVKVDRTPPVNTTPVPPSGWQNTTYTASVAGTDATSGVAGVEWKLDNGATVTTPSVSVSAGGVHTLQSRIKDVAGNYSAWRTDTINIDKVAPTLSVDCGSTEWRSTPAVCSVTADGGLSGLGAVTASVAGGNTDTITGGSYTVASDGNHSLTFRAVDGAGNEKLALAQVKIDRTPPGATVSCTPGDGTTYVCAATGTDALSGLAGLAWSVDGGAPTAITSGGTFVVSKGTVTVTATDVAGNVGSAPPLKLKARTAPTTSSPPSEDDITPRTASRAVLKIGKGSVAKRALGQLEISALPSSTTATMRPLALGSGTFHITIAVTADRKTKKSSKTYRTRSGYSPQIVVKGGGAAEVEVTLSVKKKVGRRWVSYAAGTVKL